MSERPESVSTLIKATNLGRLQWEPIGTHWVLDLSNVGERESHWIMVEPGRWPTLRWLRGLPGDHKGSTIFSGEEVGELAEVLERKFPLSSMTEDQALRAYVTFFSKFVPGVLASR